MLHHEIIGDGTPLLILHGILMDHRYMKEVLEPVFEKAPGWRRIYVDMPGHGQSPPRDGINSQDDLLSAVLEFVNAVLPDQRFAILGLSRGSYIARGIIQMRPDAVIGAALILPGGNPGSDPARLPSHEILEADPSIRPELAESELWSFDAFSVVQRRDIVETRRRVSAPARALWSAEQDARVVKAFELTCLTETEPRIFNGPSLIVAGRQDSWSGYLDAMELMPLFARATLGVLDTAGHGLPLERPDLFQALVRDWLLRLDRQVGPTP